MKFKALSTTFFSLKKGNQVEIVVEQTEKEVEEDDEEKKLHLTPPRIMDKSEELSSVQNDFMRIID